MILNKYVINVNKDIIHLQIRHNVLIFNKNNMIKIVLIINNNNFQFVLNVNLDFIFINKNVKYVLIIHRLLVVFSVILINQINVYYVKLIFIKIIMVIVLEM